MRPSFVREPAHLPLLQAILAGIASAQMRVFEWGESRPPGLRVPGCLFPRSFASLTGEAWRADGRARQVLLSLRTCAVAASMGASSSISEAMRQSLRPFGVFIIHSPWGTRLGVLLPSVPSESESEPAATPRNEGGTHVPRRQPENLEKPPKSQEIRKRSSTCRTS